MNNYMNNMNDHSSKDSINPNTIKQNNYYKEHKHLSSNSKTRNNSLSINKTNPNSKNDYRVIYSNSILNNNATNNNMYQKLENKNVLNINNKENNTIGNIKEIN